MTQYDIKTAIFTRIQKDYSKKNEEQYLRNELFNFIINNDFSDDDIQNIIAKNWWTTSFSDFVQDKYSAQQNEELIKDREKFYNKLNWYKNFNIGDKNLVVSDEFHSIYKNHEISFFQLGLITHWTLLRDGQFYIKNIDAAINLKNSLGQNSFHVLVNSLNAGPRIDYIDVFKLIATHNIHSLEDKDINGQTPLDIAHHNLNIVNNDTMYPTERSQKIKEMHINLCDNLEKVSLNQKLIKELQENESKKIKFKI